MHQIPVFPGLLCVSGGMLACAILQQHTTHGLHGSVTVPVSTVRSTLCESNKCHLCESLCESPATDAAACTVGMVSNLSPCGACHVTHSFTHLDREMLLTGTAVDRGQALHETQSPAFFLCNTKPSLVKACRSCPACAVVVLTGKGWQGRL